MAPAFGRGESLVVDGLPLDLVLVKNPSGFRLGLKSFPAAGYATMIAINDNYADGRDMSWLWDVEFDTLREGGVDQLSGSRAYDMALRLQYDDVAHRRRGHRDCARAGGLHQRRQGQAEADLLHLHSHAGHPPRAVQNHHSGGGLMTPQPESPAELSFGHELPPEESPAPGKGTIRVLQLYPRDMNIYGDWGNALVLAQRLRWHGYTPELLEYNVGDEFPADVDLIVGGGGQDSGQLVIQDDLLSRESVAEGAGRGRHPHAGDLRPVPAVREVLQDPDSAPSSRGSASWTWKPTAPTSG